MAVPVFTLSIGAAMWINSVMFVQFAAFYQGYESPDGQNIEWGIHYLSFGIPAMLVQMAAVVIFILINNNWLLFRFRTIFFLFRIFYCITSTCS